MIEKEDITQLRGLLEELKAIYDELPKEEDHTSIDNSVIWEGYNATVGKISTLSGEDFGEYKLEGDDIIRKPFTDIEGVHHDGVYVLSQVFRMKSARLIRNIGAKYFDEITTSNSQPGILVSQTLNQEQTIIVDFKTRVIEVIDKELENKGIDNDQRNFFSKLRPLISSLSNAVDLLPLILNLAKETDISIEFLNNFVAKVFNP